MNVPDRGRFTVRQIVRLTSPTPRPIRRVTLYYLLFSAALAFVAWIAPEWLATFSSGSEAGVVPSGEALALAIRRSESGLDLRPVEIGRIIFTLSCTLLLMLPISWGYMSARMRIGYDQSVIQTMLVLPIAVAGIVMVVQDSIALAFSLAGIVAAVRFRTSLSDSADALYIFLAISVGLACGVGALQIAVISSIFFNYVVLVLWHCDYGECPKSGPMPGYSSGHLLGATGAGALGPGKSGTGQKKRKKKEKKNRKAALREQETSDAEETETERPAEPIGANPTATLAPPTSQTPKI
jgi:hypothetical protein